MNFNRNEKASRLLLEDCITLYDDIIVNHDVIVNYDFDEDPVNFVLKYTHVKGVKVRRFFFSFII